MMDPISKSYEMIDDTLMYGADKTVRAWNWTTGKTNADLANGMLTIAPILESVGVLGLNLPIISLLFPFAYIFESHHQQKKNKEMERKEVNALERNLLDLDVEEMREEHGRDASVWSFFSLLGGFNTYNAPEDDYVRVGSAGFLAIGNGIRAGSHYVMRTERLPPRKNVLSRAQDSLSDLVESYSRKPSEAFYQGKIEN